MSHSSREKAEKEEKHHKGKEFSLTEELHEEKPCHRLQIMEIWT